MLETVSTFDMAEETPFPLVEIKAPEKCIMCGKVGENGIVMHRLRPLPWLTKKARDEWEKDLMKVKTKYLGSAVCPPPSACYNAVLK